MSYTPPNTVEIVVSRRGQRYFYSRTFDGQPNVDGRVINADRALQICTANAGDEIDASGQQDFGPRPCTWSVTFSFSLEAA